MMIAKREITCHVRTGKNCLSMNEKKEAYDSLDAFCAEYGLDAATKQRMRDEMLTTAPKTDMVEFANALVERFARGVYAASEREPTTSRPQLKRRGLRSVPNKLDVSPGSGRRVSSEPLCALPHRLGTIRKS
jgi:hypothetical protein